MAEICRPQREKGLKIISNFVKLISSKFGWEKFKRCIQLESHVKLNVENLKAKKLNKTV